MLCFEIVLRTDTVLKDTVSLRLGPISVTLTLKEGIASRCLLLKMTPNNMQALLSNHALGFFFQNAHYFAIADLSSLNLTDRVLSHPLVFRDENGNVAHSSNFSLCFRSFSDPKIPTTSNKLLETAINKAFQNQNEGGKFQRDKKQAQYLNVTAQLPPQQIRNNKTKETQISFHKGFPPRRKQIKINKTEKQAINKDKQINIKKISNPVEIDLELQVNKPAIIEYTKNAQPNFQTFEKPQLRVISPPNSRMNSKLNGFKMNFNQNTNLITQKNKIQFVMTTQSQQSNQIQSSGQINMKKKSLLSENQMKELAEEQLKRRKQAVMIPVRRESRLEMVPLCDLSEEEIIHYAQINRQHAEQQKDNFSLKKELKEQIKARLELQKRIKQQEMRLREQQTKIQVWDTWKKEKEVLGSQTDSFKRGEIKNISRIESQRQSYTEDFESLSGSRMIGSQARLEMSRSRLLSGQKDSEDYDQQSFQNYSQSQISRSGTSDLKL